MQPTCRNIPIHVDVAIDPVNDVVCTAEQELDLRRHIQKVVDKRFDRFRQDTSVFEDISVGEACNRNTTNHDNGRRELQRFVIYGGWSYEFDVDCRFCTIGKISFLS